MRKRITRVVSCQLPDMEHQLIKWIMEHWSQGHCFSGRMIRLRAFQIVNDIYAVHTNFSASVGWFQRFLKRHKLALRRGLLDEIFLKMLTQ